MVGAIELIEDLMENQNSFYLVPTDIIKRLIKQGKEIIKEIE